MDLAQFQMYQNTSFGTSGRRTASLLRRNISERRLSTTKLHLLALPSKLAFRPQILRTSSERVLESCQTCTEALRTFWSLHWMRHWTSTKGSREMTQIAQIPTSVQLRRRRRDKRWKMRGHLWWAIASCVCVISDLVKSAKKRPNWRFLKL